MKVTTMKKIIWVACVSLLFACNRIDTDKVHSNVSSPDKSIIATSDGKKKESPERIHNGPFGLDMGISRAELEGNFGFNAPDPSVPEYYRGIPPKTVTGLSGYFAFVGSTAGICKLGAMSPVEIVNGSGDQIKAETDRVSEMLSAKYGKASDKINFSKEKVYDRNPEYWMMGLKEESVFYGYVWDNSKSREPALPNNIESIEIAAAASSTKSAWVSITYTFKNAKDCIAEVKKRKSANL